MYKNTYTVTVFNFADLGKQFIEHLVDWTCDYKFWVSNKSINLKTDKSIVNWTFWLCNESQI